MHRERSQIAEMLFREGTASAANFLPICAAESGTTPTEKRVLKQYPWGAIATNSTLYFRGVLFSLIIMFAKTVPLGVQTVSAPFFSECTLKKTK